jgi:pilus assembly protein CpaB
VKARRRRGLVLVSLALASGGLAASQVHQRERQVEAQVGPLVSVLVAARDLPAGARLGSGSLARRRVPAPFVPPDALTSPAELAGARTGTTVAAGGYLTAGHLREAGGDASGGAPGTALEDGERALEVAVSGGSALAQAAVGSRVDVVVCTESREGAGRAFVALEDVELLGLRAGAGSGTLEAEDAVAGASAAAEALAVLRVTLRQAVYLTAAENFGREVRLLVRPPGDRGRSAGASTTEGEL